MPYHLAAVGGMRAVLCLTAPAVYTTDCTLPARQPCKYHIHANNFTAGRFELTGPLFGMKQLNTIETFQASQEFRTSKLESACDGIISVEYLVNAPSIREHLVVMAVYLRA